MVAGLLGSGLLPKSYLPFEKVSAAIAARYALGDSHEHRTLLFVLPRGTETTARCVLSGLLIASYGHEHGAGKLPSGEIRRLITGNVLFITHSPSGGIQALKDISFADQTPLSNLWDVIPLAYSGASTRQRVFVSHPGWLQEQLANRRFSAIVIDATHHKVQAELEGLLQVASAICPLCFAVTPALPTNFTSSTTSGNRDVWLWDPIAIANARKMVGLGGVQPPAPFTQSILICTEDVEADTLLAKAYGLVSQAVKLAERRRYPGSMEVRTILNRLRNLTVPLPRLEQTCAGSWNGTLRDRVRGLSEIHSHGMAAWDSTWPDLKAAVEQVYKAFLERRETAKFWPLAMRLDALIRRSAPHIRVVTSTRAEAELLARDLNDTVDDVGTAVALGRLEIVAALEEARQVALGNTAVTLLSGARRHNLRYLNLYPSLDVTEFAYPFEAYHERAAIESSYEHAAAFAPRRPKLLARIGLDALSNDVNAPISPHALTIENADGRPISFSIRPYVETGLSLDDLLSPQDGGQERTYVARNAPAPGLHGHTIRVTLTNGEVFEYPESHMVDMYYDATDTAERVKAGDLHVSAQILQFVDGQYDDLFFRTAEALKSRLGFKDRARLALWEEGRRSLFANGISLRALHEQLRARGLSTSYATFTTWFREGAPILAPQQLEEFAVVAEETGLFPREELVKETFKCIQTLRGRHRKIGRKLHAVLRALRTQSQYEEALEGVREIDPDIADAYAAVRLVEVKSVERL